ncbi:MAG: hypothetical protein U0U70_01910 [Chitinophagaceae bacterium]
METNSATILLIPKEEWEGLKTSQQAILQQLQELNTKGLAGIPQKNITAKEFMEAVRIKRTKFDQLVLGNKIRVIKKRRKIYVPVSEIERYFSDPTIL